MNILAPQEKFENLLREVGCYLATQGLRRSRQNFRRVFKEGGIRWDIGFQKDKHSTRKDVGFTINVYVESKLRPLHYEEWQKTQPWYGGAGDRIGFLMPKREDAWWQIKDGTSEALLIAEIIEALQAFALPFLRKFESQNDLDKHYRHLISRGPMNYGLALLAFCMVIRDRRSSKEVEQWAKALRHHGQIEAVPGETVEQTIKMIMRGA